MISVNLLSFYDADSKEKRWKDDAAQTIDPSLLPSVSAEEKGYMLEHVSICRFWVIA
jgi:hypothetical protein